MENVISINFVKLSFNKSVHTKNKNDKILWYLVYRYKFSHSHNEQRNFQLLCLKFDINTKKRKLLLKIHETQER